MGGSSNSLFGKLLNNVFPKVPDFYSMINEQCTLLVEATEVFVNFNETGDPALAAKVREYEHRGDEVKWRNIDTLNKAFATPMDREDIYRAINSVDMIKNYLKTTVREMEALDLKPDQHTLHMASLLREGCEGLKRGFGKLGINPILGEEDAQTARKAERNIEKVYRGALSELFTAEKELAALRAGDPAAGAAAMERTLEIFKRRELYRHMSNTGDYVANAADVLHDIIVQIA